MDLVMLVNISLLLNYWMLKTITKLAETSKLAEIGEMACRQFQRVLEVQQVLKLLAEIGNVTFKDMSCR